MKFCTWMLLSALSIPSFTVAQDSQNSKPRHHTYRLIDLGTFGGPRSYLNTPDITPIGAPVLNNRGTVAGWADTSTPDPLSPNFCFGDCFVAHAFRSRGEGKTDLGALPATTPTSSQANWIARNGLIAGLSENGEIDPLVPGFPEFRAVLWQGDDIVNLGTLQGGHESVANAVNSNGEVAGVFTNTVPDANSMFGLGFETRAFVWKDGVMQDLGTLGGPDAMALLVNERGQVAGASYISSEPGATCGANFPLPLATGAFFWENGKMTNLGSFGGTCTLPSELNDRGQISGVSTLPGDQYQLAFLWDNGVLTALQGSGTDSTGAIALNNDGDVAGFAFLKGSFFYQASLWKDGKQTYLGTIGKDLCSYSTSINARDQIVGVSAPMCDFAMPRAFLYENGGIVDLNTLIPAGSKLTLTAPQTINDRGEIAGVGLTAKGNQHAFLLIPNGDCDDECEVRVAGQSNAIPTAQNALGMKQSSGAVVGRANQLRNRWMQRFRIAGQPVARPN